MEPFDLLDKKLLSELDLDARQPAAKLAKKLRKSKETVNFRINRLLTEGYLKGFYAILNTSKLGWYYHKMYFRLRDCTPKKEAEIFEFIQSRPNIAYLAKMTGPYDGVCLVLCRSAVQMAQFLEPLMQRYGTFIRSKEFALFLTTHRFNQKFIWSAEERKDWHYPEPLGSYALDTVDSRIIEILSAQARRPLTEIAQIVGVDAKVVKYRLRKLEQDGIVLAYVSSPNFERLGLRFVQLNMALKDPTARKAILQYFDSTDKCLYAMEMIGRYDLAVELHVSSDKELEAVVDGFRQKFVEKIQDYDVSVIDREFVVEWGPVKMGKK